jgi:ATP-dependent DNA helicase DinG
LQRLHDGTPSGPLEELLGAVRGMAYARDESGGQEAGYGLETEAAQLDGDFIERAGTAQAALAAIRQPLMRLGVRLEALLSEPPDWLDGPGRARIEGARLSLGWRVDLLSAWESLLARMGGAADRVSSTGWRSIARTGASSISGCIAAGSTRCSPLPRPCWSRRMA